MTDQKVLRLYNNAFSHMENTAEDWDKLFVFLKKICTHDNYQDCLECYTKMERKFNKEKGG